MVVNIAITSACVLVRRVGDNFHSLEVVDRVSETQVQMGENSQRIVVMFLNDMTSHKLQHKLSQLFYCHLSVLYNISKILSDKSGGKYRDRW